MYCFEYIVFFHLFVLMLLVCLTYHTITQYNNTVTEALCNRFQHFFNIFMHGRFYQKNIIFYHFSVILTQFMLQ